MVVRNSNLDSRWIKKPCLFVSIDITSKGFEPLKHVGFFMRWFNSNISHRSFIFLLANDKLKYPSNTATALSKKSTHVWNKIPDTNGFTTASEFNRLTKIMCLI